ncbi:response regulator [Paraburkholderia phymatum]|uniref:Two component transcriptional regulator, LuxR family n=1 Tax=Paraburkholderia phymatum (strain DSM 17167 / CIP 108236 / LMG 21445 / STM815) TaxID=391038 RepID=B2JWB2_PARP8|nr:response regulator [Paraburkholderia phymatum]ACC75239.1 two component transcriptional regulator, LuxR family [Paraburkholderia phymatum STM815]
MNDTTLIRILVVDDHTLFRRGIIALLSTDERFVVVGEAGDAGEACRRANETQPDVILLDNHLPGVRGIDVLPGLAELAPQARVLMLTVSEDEQDLAAALRGGARGYLLKTVDSSAMADAIVRIMAGESTISPEMTGKLVSAFQALQPGEVPPAASPSVLAPAVPDPIESLSARQEEILAHIARGETNKEIARALNIAETTVKIHVQQVLKKLKLASRVQAATYAVMRMRHA